MDFILFVHLAALLFSFFVAGCLFGALFSTSIREKLEGIISIKHLERLLLARSIHNPILRPGTTPWTAEAVMNPAALVLAGRTHLMYRAIGMDGVSRLGYASSADGITFDIRLPYPAYVAAHPHVVPSHHHARLPIDRKRFSPVMYASGGSWGGCEDPRMVTIDGRVYITFNIFDGWDFIRIAVISISEQDFLDHRFVSWRGPHILSKPNEIHKNWVLFPEKMGGKFAVLHSVAPEIEIAYVDRLEDVGTKEPFIESWAGPRSGLVAREDSWDSFVRGAGPPPLRTDRGWLLLYHAIDKREPGRYKLGVMLLDLEDPTRVLYRASSPILSPDQGYENHGKPGIVYACGAVIRQGTLFVYYGGADKVVCVATAPLTAFLDALTEGSQPSLETIPAQTT